MGFTSIRKMAQLLLLFLACIGLCFCLSLWQEGETLHASGRAIDLKNDKPVAGVKIRFHTLNNSVGEAVTNEQGHFSEENLPPLVGFIAWVSDPHYAGLMGSVFGTSVNFTAPGQHQDGITVPAIPGGEISGRVMDEGGNPIAGCSVSALRPEQLDNPKTFEHVEKIETELQGRFRFQNLDMGRYYLLAECDHLEPGEEKSAYNGITNSDWRRRESWPHVLYPNARSIGEARAINLLPGSIRAGLDFRMKLAPSFSLRGTFVRAGGDPPHPDIFYSSDLTLTATDIGVQQSCLWDTKAAEFRCDFLSPGRYRLRMNVGSVFPGNLATALSNGSSGITPDPQSGTVAIEISEKQQPPELKIQLNKVHEKPVEISETAEASGANSGTLKIGACDASASTRASYLYISPFTNAPDRDSAERLESSRKLIRCPLMLAVEKPAGTYWIVATTTDYWKLKPAIVDLILKHGTKATLQAGRETAVAVPVFTPRDIYQMAVESLSSAP
jgi:hypothetical protein